MKQDLHAILSAWRQFSPVVIDVPAEVRYVLLQRYFETSIRNARLGIVSFALMLFGIAYEAPFVPRLAGLAAFIGVLLLRIRLARRSLVRLDRAAPRSNALHDLVLLTAAAIWPMSLFAVAPFISQPNVYAVVYVSFVVLTVVSVSNLAALPASVMIAGCSLLPLVMFLVVREEEAVLAFTAVATLICSATMLLRLRDGHATLLQALASERENGLLVKELQTYRRKLETENASLGSSLRDASAAASRDPLTGLYNRRYLAAFAEPLVALVDAMREDVTVCMVDIDHFKRINDRHGHAVGDEVLCRMAGLLGTRLRDRDCLARVGGEEFVIVLRRCDVHRGNRVAEALRHNVASADIDTAAGEIDVTVSVGVAQWGAGETFDVALQRADRSLYRAKRDGRDRVEIDVEDARPPAPTHSDSTLPAPLQ